MRAKVREHYNGDPCLIFGGPGEGLTIECEVTDPPSSVGKRIPVYVDADMVEKLLLEFRRHAARRRAAPIKAAADGTIEDGHHRAAAAGLLSLDVEEIPDGTGYPVYPSGEIRTKGA